MAAGIVLALLAGPLLARWLRGPGARGASTGLGDAFGNVIDVFEPGQARSAREIKRHHDAGPVTRSPDDEDEDPVRLVTNPDGSPRAVRVRRPRD
ncbi:MAG: hypothetical protein R2731_17295 [Nocardioides sp.]